jgi:hypothetical protein
MKLGSRSLSGEVVLSRVARNFAGTLSELNDGVFLIELEPGERWHCGVWVSLYGSAPNRAGLQESLQSLMTRLFPVAATV